MTVQRSMSNYSGRLCRVIHDDRAVIALLNEGTLIAYARYIVLSIIRFTIKSVNREEKNRLRKVHELASYHGYALITLNFFKSYSTFQTILPADSPHCFSFIADWFQILSKGHKYE